ncbi:hypothetical protein Syun_013209 [Stephania yunnanensis]|uniref:EGF-like domain-containing protein n=1 Tax=Stephania yunnanensis TaxID=152371 RepID=A0AAP0K1N1_9MAGN
MVLRLTNEQISAGIWYIGLFNGIGYERTQSKMINRGSSFTFSANISVDGCTVSGLWGPYCNRAIVPVSCDHTAVYEDSKNIFDASSHNQTAESNLTCQNSLEVACSRSSELKLYSLDLTGMIQFLKIVVKDAQFNQTISGNSTKKINGTLYARHGAIPSIEFHDYSVDIVKSPLVVESPKIGRWYIGILPANGTRITGAVGNNNINSDLCYSLDWEVFECPAGKAGPNCTAKTYILQAIPGKNPSPPDFHYLPVDGKMSPEAAKFPLEPLLSNSSGNNSDIAWTYFVLDIPREVGGGNIHVQLQADTTLTYELYSRFGGLPSLDTWDYYYANKSSNSNGSLFFKVYDSSDEGASFYILNAREGRWIFGLRHRVLPIGISNLQTTMSLTVERCPNKCSGHGGCKFRMDDSGLSFYSYCDCDRDYGGFDCDITIVPHSDLPRWTCALRWISSSCHVPLTWHVLQSVALIASNAAAILPAYWALRKKAYAEWVIFTTSGVSSALYHACDVGTWCVLTFHVLQFMDFWLSFMAVASTFIYLTTVEEVTKRAIHACVAILTALMAATGATRSSNIPLVIGIGASGLFIGLVIEFSTTLKSILCSRRLNVNMIERWLSFKVWLYNLLKTIRSRFRWIFVLVGFILVAMAAVSWKMESTASYWIWHSVWHVTIYASSFFFLCSKSLR